MVLLVKDPERAPAQTDSQNAPGKGIVEDKGVVYRNRPRQQSVQVLLDDVTV
jgi:hypothetical protein